MKWKIVPLAAAHTETLARLESLCFSRPWSREALEAEIHNPSAVFFTALAGEEIAGYAGMHCAAGECYVDNIAVFPAFRRQGAATALLAALEREARSRDGEFLSLEVRVSNENAVALYQKLGFVPVGERKNYYTGPVENGLIMTKAFSPCSLGKSFSDFR